MHPQTTHGGRGPWRPRRRAALVTLAALAAVLGPMAVAVSVAAPATTGNWAPVTTGDFPDPSVLYVPGNGSTTQGEYYAFATQNFASAAQTINVQEAVSNDGETWTQVGSDALPTAGGLGSWAIPGNTWAPSVAYDSTDNDYVMYYTATQNGSGDQCIGVATSKTPLGPYADTSSTPAICQNGASLATIDNGNYGGSIDPDVFTDDSGNSWLIWKSDGNHIGASTVLWSVPLNDHVAPASKSPVALLDNDPSSWEADVIEGPFMYETQTPNGNQPPKDNFYLFFSGNDEGTASYAVGWASCAGPTGPCTDQTTATGPILSSAPGMSGPGGPTVFTTTATQSQASQTVLAFAAWKGTTVGYFSCGIRPMYESDLTFATPGGPPQLTDANPGASPAVGATCPGPPPTPPPGYWQVASDGGIFTFGAAQFYGSTGNIRLNQPVVGMAATPDGKGYWLVASDGGIFAYGDAQFYGSTGNITLNKPIIAMIPTLNGGGYWLIASDGGVFAFGDAPFYGSTGGNAPPYPMTAAAPGYLGGGYWMVDANGQVFNFGNASAEGSPPSAPGGYTISGIAPTHDDHGYWLSSWNGNVADFGDAGDYGSMYGTNLNAPVVGITATADGHGYWLQGKDGGIFTFGDAPFLGSMGGVHLNAPMVGITSM